MHLFCIALFNAFSAQIFALVLIIAVMFTFSFGSAFAALQYEGTTTTEKPVAEKTDFTGYNSTTAKTQGTFGISTVEQKSEVAGLEAKKDLEDGEYPAELQAKVDAAYDTAIAAVKAAKTNKEMNAAKETLKAALEKLELADNTYEALKDSIDWEDTISFTVGDIEEAEEYYVVPDAGLVVAEYGVVTADDPIVFNWLMDQGYYGYVGSDAWKKVLSSPSVRNAVIDWLEDYYVGTVSFAEVYDTENPAKVSDLAKYGRTVYAEYLTVVGAVSDYADKKTTTIDEFVAVVDKYIAFEEKYMLISEGFADDPLDGYDVTDDSKLLVAIDKWYIDNLEDAVDAIEKINTVAGYTAAKADIIAAAKKVVDVLDKYYEDYPYLAYYMLDEFDALNTIVNALAEVMEADTTALDKVCKDTAYTENKEVTAGKTATFDSSEANLAAIAAARAAFDAYVADYTFVYEANEAYDDGEGVESIVDIETLIKYETKLLAAEYNKAAVPATADKEFAEKSAKVQAVLDNATVKVTTQALGNRKIRVQAKIDADSFDKLAGYTIEYKFYKKTAKATSYKGYSDRAVNYTTFTKLTKGTKYNFKCAVTVKDKDGNVLATKGYLGSTTGIRTAK